MKERMLKINPINRNNSINIVLVSSAWYVPFLAVTLESLFQKKEYDSCYDIVVLYENIDVATRKKIRRKYNSSNFYIRFFDIHIFFDKGDYYTRNHLSYLSYCRLLIPDIMKQYDKVIYLDCDLIVEVDLTDLFNLDIEDYFFAAVPDTITTIEAWYNPYNDRTKRYLKKCIGLSKGQPYINGGVLVLNIRKLQNTFFEGELIKLAKTRKWHWLDQDVLNYKFKGKIKILSVEWNFIVDPNYVERKNIIKNNNYIMEYKKAFYAPKIIHFASQTSPCYIKNISFGDNFWKYAEHSLFYNEIKCISSIKKDLYKNIKKMFQFVFPKKTVRKKIITKLIYFFMYYRTRDEFYK